jgi:hypothetical protein
MQQLTLERANALLAYVKETGDFIWLVNRQGHARKGEQAGTLAKPGFSSEKAPARRLHFVIDFITAWDAQQ